MARLRRRDLLAFTIVTPLLRQPCLWAAAPARAEAKPEDDTLPSLEVDGRLVGQHVLSARMRLPAAPGPLALVYPKWLPGEHAPVGRIEDLVDLVISVAGKPIAWTRDSEDMYQISCVLPAGTTAVDLAFAYVAGTGGRSDPLPAVGSQSLWILKWNHVLLYPKGTDPRSYRVSASVRLPAGWTFATALDVAAKTADGVRFAPTSLETLIDSPVASGGFGRTVDLTPTGGPRHELCLFGDSREAVEIKDPEIQGLRQLVVEAHALFAGWPYRRYRFLLSLSNHVPAGGLEHHESSDNRLPERTLTDDASWVVRAGLLPHEHVHSWNGKLRRPAGLVPHDYQQAMKTDLLWVYEGLTTYLGETLTSRAGLRSPHESRDALAYTAATMDVRTGRQWRPLGDTATSAPMLSGAARAWRGLRRGLDYYPESQLIWLEADMAIRRGSNGARSLDDFCQLFHGRHAQGVPAVVPYELDEVLSTLNRIHAHDWAGFFRARVDALAPRAPLRGIELSGWRLVYRDTASSYLRKLEQATREIDHSFSLGLVLHEDGGVIDVLPGSPAGKAGIAPAATVVAVGGRRFSREVLSAALAATRSTPDLDLLIENQDMFRTVKVVYKGGPSFPTLERILAEPDLLATSWARRGGAPRVP